MNSRLLPMLFTGLALALGMLAAVQFLQSLRNAGAIQNTPSQTAPQQDINKTVTPVIFQTISEQDGLISITGSSEAEANLALHDESQKLLEFMAEKDGQWSTSINIDPTQHLSLDLFVDVQDGARIRSDESVYRIPLIRSEDQVETEGSEDRAKQALILITAPGGPSRIIQSPFRGLPTSGALSLGAIDYDKSGGVIFSGVSASDGKVAILANDSFIGEAQVGPDGRWFLIAAETLPLGKYDIRAQLIIDNEEKASISLPFQRFGDVAEFDQLSDVLQVNYSPFGWQMSRSLYGGGQQFTAILAPEEADNIFAEN